jgi:hypothetical protein
MGKKWFTSRQIIWKLREAEVALSAIIPHLSEG